MSNPGDSAKRHLSTPGASDMALLTMGNSDIEFWNRSRHGGDSETQFFLCRTLMHVLNGYKIYLNTTHHLIVNCVKWI